MFAGREAAERLLYNGDRVVSSELCRAGPASVK